MNRIALERRSVETSVMAVSMKYLSVPPATLAISDGKGLIH
jgi:hypothetical protein